MKWSAASDWAQMLVLAIILMLVSLSGLLDRSLDLQSQYAGSLRPPSADVADLAASYGDNYEVYRFIRARAPNSIFYLDASTDVGLSTAALYTYSEVAAVQSFEGVVIPRPPETPAAIISGRDNVWTFWLQEGGTAEELVAFATQSTDRGEETVVIDAALLPPEIHSVLPDARAKSERTFIGRIGTQFVREILVYLVLTMAGFVLVPPNIPPYVRPPLALLLGICLTGLGALFLFQGLAGLVPLLVAAALTRRYVFGSWLAYSREDVRPVLFFVTAAALVVLSAYFAGAVVVTSDSFIYLVGGHELADGRFGLQDFSLKRGAVLQGLYGLGFSMGVDILVAPGLVTLLAATGLLCTFGWHRGQTRTQRFAIAAFVMTPWLHIQPLSFARYVNTHVYVGAFLLALVLTLYWAEECGLAERRKFSGALMIFAAMPVLLRAEGAVLVALILLGASRTGRKFEIAWWAVGGMTVLWGALLYLAALRGGAEPSRLLIAFMALGFGLLLVPAATRRQPRLWTATPLVLAGLWAFTLLLTTGITGRASSFVSAAVVNLGEGRGRWGTFAPMLFLLAILAVAMRPNARVEAAEAAARTLVIGFIPVSLVSKIGDGVFVSGGSFLDLLLARGGGGRVGWGDSVNRMWMHAVMLVLLLAVMRFTGNERVSSNLPSQSLTRSPDAGR